jgi:hypothetical protein
MNLGHSGIPMIEEKIAVRPNNLPNAENNPDFPKRES